MLQPFVRPTFRVFPPQELRTPLEATYSLLVIHPRAKTYVSRPYCSRFPRRPRINAVAWFPRWLWASFWLTRFACLLVTLDLNSQNRLVPPASPSSKSYSSCESVCTCTSYPAHATVTLLVFSPLEFFLSTPRILDPPKSEDLNTPIFRRIRTRLEGPRNPSSRVKPSPHQGAETASIDGYPSPSRRPAPPRRWRSDFLRLCWGRASSTPSAFRSLKVREQWRFSEEMPPLLRFLAFSPIS
jgi:hypothetical protein